MQLVSNWLELEACGGDGGVVLRGRRLMIRWGNCAALVVMHRHKSYERADCSGQELREAALYLAEYLVCWYVPLPELLGPWIVANRVAW